MPITDGKIRNAKASQTSIRLSDGGSLQLVVKPSGAKLWRYRDRIGGKENVFAIGQYFNDGREGHVSLEAARKARDESRHLVKQGIHPAHFRRSAKVAVQTDYANTFAVVA